MRQMAINAVPYFAKQPLLPRHLLIDHDAECVVKVFDAVLEAEGVEVKRQGLSALNLNARGC
jgi:hypothetical protein